MDQVKAVVVFAEEALVGAAEEEPIIKFQVALVEAAEEEPMLRLWVVLAEEAVLEPTLRFHKDWASFCSLRIYLKSILHNK